MQTPDTSVSSTARAIDEILARHKPIGRSGLLPALVEAQDVHGWLSPSILHQIADGLQVPTTEVFGVADFYAHLYTRPVGKQILRICDDVTCFLAGSERLISAVNRQTGLGDQETATDGSLTIEIVPCLGHCAHAPVAMLGARVIEHATPESVTGLLPPIEPQTKR